MSEALSREERAAAIEILTAWNGSRPAMTWSVDKFPHAASAMLAAARRVLIEEIAP